MEIDWNWERMRAQYARWLEAAEARGLTQEQIAKAGGLGEHNSYVSKMKKPSMEGSLGPKAETFIRLIAGLGIPVSDFFAELEGRAPHVDASGMTPPLARLDRDQDRTVIINAVIETLQRGVAAPARPSRRRRRKKH